MIANDIESVVGLFVTYSGDRCNNVGFGAVVEVAPADLWGGPYATIVLDDGREFLRVSIRDIMENDALDEDRPTPANTFVTCDGKKAFPEGIAALRAGAATAKAKASASKTIAAARRAEQAEALKAQYPYLTPRGESNNGGKLVAKNIRAILKKKFTGIKFSVTSRDYSVVNVRWSDGPSGEAVRDLIGAFKAGSFDGMTDCYEYDEGAWNDAFGSVRYVFMTRNGFMV